MKLTALPVHELALDPSRHPRGRPHLSAASGLVCLGGRAYVIADDEHHLAVFHDPLSPGSLHRIVPGALPTDMQARKERKPDFETLFLLPPSSSRKTALVGLGSGSRKNRRMGVLIPLKRNGKPSKRTRRFDLRALYKPLEKVLGEINIEGAMVIGEELVLLNRGNGKALENVAVRYRLADFVSVVGGRREKIEPLSLRRYDLGSIAGVKLGFTDGAALPDGGWIFTAVAEATDDSFADGACVGSAVGAVAADGRLRAILGLDPPLKVEGIDILVKGRDLTICLVTDADDPGQAAWLMTAQFTGETLRYTLPVAGKPSATLSA